MTLDCLQAAKNVAGESLELSKVNTVQLCHLLPKVGATSVHRKGESEDGNSSKHQTRLDREVPTILHKTDVPRVAGRGHAWVSHIWERGNYGREFYHLFSLMS